MSAPTKSGRGLLRTVLLVLVALGGWFLKQRTGDEGEQATRAAPAPATQEAPAAPGGSGDSGGAPATAEAPRSGDGGAARIAQAFARNESDLQIEVDAVVRRSLPDDEDGSRHQRFILELSDGATVLVAHNIDLAPRVPLREGDRVQVFGEYEWNDRGGVLHWTHHDPARRHVGGWIKHGGKTYE